MLISDGRITLTASEANEFAAATFAPWTPRTIAEFNAMCDLGSARHAINNTEGVGFMHCLAVETMKFGPNGEMNFPIDHRKMAYVKLHGTWPSDDELKAFEADGSAARPGLTLVRK